MLFFLRAVKYLFSGGVDCGGGGGGCPRRINTEGYDSSGSKRERHISQCLRDRRRGIPKLWFEAVGFRIRKTFNRRPTHCNDALRQCFHYAIIMPHASITELDCSVRHCCCKRIRKIKKQNYEINQYCSLIFKCNLSPGVNFKIIL